MYFGVFDALLSIESSKEYSPLLPTDFPPRTATFIGACCLFSIVDDDWYVQKTLKLTNVEIELKCQLVESSKFMSGTRGRTVLIKPRPEPSNMRTRSSA